MGTTVEAAASTATPGKRNYRVTIMPEITDREWGMFRELLEGKLDILTSGQEEINTKLSKMPCTEHGEALATLADWRKNHEDGSKNPNGGKWLAKNWRLVAIVLGAGALGGGSGKVAENLGAILKVFLENMGK